MTRLPVVTGSQLIAGLERAGFVVARVRGSHPFLRHQDGRATVVAAHAGESVGPGLMSKILRNRKLNREDLRTLPE